MRIGLSASLLALLLLGASAVAGPPKAEDHVVLRSGRVLAGKVVGEVKLEVGKAYRIETDFGEILVPKRATRKFVLNEEPDPEATFAIRRIRVVRFVGKVERLPAQRDRSRAVTGDEGAEAWIPLSWKGADDRDIVNAPNAMVRPGDTIRTGADGELDFMPHKDVWIRVAANSVVVIPEADPASDEGSLTLKRGKTLQDVRSTPRGQVFRVRTPLTLLSTRGSFSSLRVEDGDESVAVREGEVELLDRGTVASGGRARWRADGIDRDTAADFGSEFDLEMQRFPVEDMTLVPAGRYELAGLPLQAVEAEKPLRKRIPGRASPPPDSRRPWDSDFRKDVHVRIDAFLIDRDETTIAAVRAFTASRSQRGGVQSQPAVPAYAAKLRYSTAAAFARWCGKQIPTEVQWETAARGADRRPFPWGARVPEEYWDAPTDGRPGPHLPTFDVSPFGVLRLGTNVVEWTRSKWGDAPFFDVLWPTRANEPDRDLRVYRGLFGAIRRRGSSADRGHSCGFRLVTELEPDD